MKKIGNIQLIAALLVALVGWTATVCAENIEAKLPSNDGSDAFQVQDSNGTPWMHVQSNGRVGIGTATPGYKLHVESSGATTVVLKSTGSQTYLALDRPTTSQYARLLYSTDGAAKFALGLDDDGTDDFHIGNPNLNAKYLTVNRTYGYVGIGNGSPTHLFDVGTSGAHCDGQTWNDASSREYKENIKSLTLEEAIEAFNGLRPVKYNYRLHKEEDRVGFIAEDVPDLVAMNGRKNLNTMDIVAVLTKVMQEQQKTIAAFTERVTEQQQTISELQKTVSALKLKTAELELTVHSDGDPTVASIALPDQIVR